MFSRQIEIKVFSTSQKNKVLKTLEYCIEDQYTEEFQDIEETFLPDVRIFIETDVHEDRLLRHMEDLFSDKYEVFFDYSDSSTEEVYSILPKGIHQLTFDQWIKELDEVDIQELISEKRIIMSASGSYQLVFTRGSTYLVKVLVFFVDDYFKNKEYYFTNADLTEVELLYSVLDLLGYQERKKVKSFKMIFLDTEMPKWLADRNGEYIFQQ